MPTEKEGLCDVACLPGCGDLTMFPFSFLRLINILIQKNLENQQLRFL
jgi:hypothetical protein